MGFNSLSNEDLATAAINQEFPRIFQERTGEDWNAKYKSKANERLAGSKFDLQWLSKSGTENNQFEPLFELCRLGDVEKVKEYINDNGTDTLFAVDESMRSPLHIAAMNGHAKLVETLISQGSSIEARDKCLRTPIQLGGSAGHVPVVNALIELGANLMAKDSVFFSYKIDWKNNTSLCGMRKFIGACYITNN